ncbi:MAG TPA: septal ring lytic transglycosylase RlpA family protein, partial [Thermoanaerobaculia bacterium]|nr:septal ring lytic transglycosylase RlpA family protein [Thermoanaerobaculia bacterium]
TPQVPQTTHGIASWYGEEFAGRTTANGEIFDPMLLTAAHRTLPFGTIVDVKNSTTGQTVRVRINDRGPFVGNRMIDLSFAAAQQIGLIDPGSGQVDVTVVAMGRGEREPPAPYTVTVNQPKEQVKISSEEPPKVEFPLPTTTTSVAPAIPPTTAGKIAGATQDNDFGVQVVEEHHGVETRKQVSPDGKTVETVVLGGAPAASPAQEQAEDKPAPARAPAPHRITPGFLVQVGAFGIEANAKALQSKLAQLGQQSHIDHVDTLYRVRMGPYATREEAIRARGALETNGMSAIVIAADTN